MNDTTDLFAKIVGQESAKRKLGFYLRGHKQTGVIPNLLFSAPKGCGKTFLAQEFRKGLIRREGDDAGKKPKPLVSVNCSTIKSVKQFFNSLIIPMISDKEITCLFDEASELPHDVTMALLTILQPNQENANQFSYEDYTVDFNFARQTFLFCTSETHRIFSPLLDRLERINLESYSHSQLEEIVKRNLPGVEFEPSALNGVSSVLRGNARSAQKMANDIKSYLGGSQVFMLEDWSKMKYELGINDLGLSPIEIQVLRILRDHKETSLTRLSAVTGLSRESLQKDAEMYLQNLDLMGISTLGRYLTGKGFEYLKGLVC